MQLCCMAEQLTQDQKKQYAEMLFLRGDIEQKEIAKIVGVSQVTMSKWVNDEEANWKAKRKSFMVTKQETIRLLYNVCEKLAMRAHNAEDGGDTKDADKLIKYTASLKNLETEASIAEIMEVAIIFTKWLQPIDPALALTVTNHFDKFIKDRLKRF